MPKAVGKWTLGDQLGNGGQGRVFKGVPIDEPNASPVAVKLLTNSANPKARARFNRELEALKRIDHPSVVKPLAHSTPDEPDQYYVMPYMDGVTTLHKHIWPASSSPRRKSVGEALDFVAKCAEAVHAAHVQNVVHRDLKPLNILVTSTNCPVIIDFGCCLLLDDDGVLTLTDEGVGARNFMAPETEAGIEGNTSPKCDIYSLGKLLWCMVTGERAFARERAGFTNRLATTMLPEDPFAGYVVEAMLRSARGDPSHRMESASTFGKLLAVFAQRVRQGIPHRMHSYAHCPLCDSGHIRPGKNQIDGPYPLDAHCLGVNASNNPHVEAVLCTDCGHIGIRDRRPITKLYEEIRSAE